MTENMYSAEEAAQILGLQVRTVRNYVREGRLPGIRIGKQYRISRADLEAFTAGAGAREAALTGHLTLEQPRSQAAAEVASVVQIDGIGEPGRDRLEGTVAAAAALAAQGGGSQLRVEPLYDAERRRLKLIIVGTVAEVVELLRVVELFSAEPD
jgi:excisionase family DNA binding protein